MAEGVGEVRVEHGHEKIVIGDGAGGFLELAGGLAQAAGERGDDSVAGRVQRERSGGPGRRRWRMIHGRVGLAVFRPLRGPAGRGSPKKKTPSGVAPEGAK